MQNPHVKQGFVSAGSSAHHRILKKRCPSKEKKSVIECFSFKRPLPLTVLHYISEKCLEINLKSVGHLLLLRLHQRW